VFRLSLCPDGADSMIRSGVANKALVIGAETFSRILDWKTARPVCCSATAQAPWCWHRGRRREGRGILASKLHADGRHNQLLYVDGGPSTTVRSQAADEGAGSLRHAVTNLASVLSEVLDMAVWNLRRSIGLFPTRPISVFWKQPRASLACR